MILAIMGPTASGKTALACELADHHGAVDIISVDSAMIYKGMDIGTAKPTQAELAHYPHQLIDIRDPKAHYSAAQFVKDARGCIQNSLSAGRLPVLVGGTMLYFHALIQGLAPLPDRDEQIRTRLTKEAAQTGWPALHARLAELDPDSAQEIKPQDAQRLQRALEVYELTGEPLSQLKLKTTPLDWPIIPVGITPPDRSLLHQRIEQRLKSMLDGGFLAEVESLYTRGDLDDTLPSIRCVGYRQFWHYLQGQLDYDTACEKALVATRQLAKRQLTWLRSWPNLKALAQPDLHMLLKHLP